MAHQELQRNYRLIVPMGIDTQKKNCHRDTRRTRYKKNIDPTIELAR
jgi:hypothetical protein